jgi:ribosome biogenesis GTPase A
LKGEELDTMKAAGILVDEYRAGKLGRITLELPDEESGRENNR